jgi:hypothetical protein
MGYEMKRLRPFTEIVFVFPRSIWKKPLPGQNVEYFGVENQVVRNVTTGLDKG